MTQFNRNKADLISFRQLGWLMITVYLSTGITFGQTLLAEKAGKSGWLSILIAGLVTLLLLWIIVETSIKNPKQSLVENLRSRLGKALGNIVTVIYLLLIFFLLIMITYQAVRITELNFIYIYINPYIFIVIAYLLVIYMITGGATILVRVNDTILPIFLLLLLVIMILDIPFIELDRGRPLWPGNWGDVIRGASLPLILFSELTAISMLWPYCRDHHDKKKAIKTMGFLVVQGILIMSFIAWALIITFGAERTSSLIVPIYYLAREIFYGQFISNFQILLLPMILGSIMIKIALFIFVLTDGLQQMGWSKYSWSIPYLLSTAVIISTMNLIKSDHQFSYYLTHVSVWLIPALFFIHSFLWLANVIYQRKSSTRG